MIELALCIASLLIVGTIFIHYKIRQNPTPELQKNWRRLMAWWMIFAACLFAFSLGLVGISLLSVGLMAWAGIELKQMLQLKKIPILTVVFTILLIALTIVILLSPIADSLFFICLFLASFTFYIKVDGSLFWYIFYSFCTLSLASIILLSMLAKSAELHAGHLLLMLFFIISMNDIAQYMSGKLFGKTRITGQLSPNKTVEGVIGGMLVSSLLCGYLIPTILFTTHIEAAIIGAIVGIVGFLGDLNLSRIKRSLDLKDSGTSIMGHGGLFDRIDSLLLVVPVFGALLVFRGYL